MIYIASCPECGHPQEVDLDATDHRCERCRHRWSPQDEDGGVGFCNDEEWEEDEAMSDADPGL